MTPFGVMENHSSLFSTMSEDQQINVFDGIDDLLKLHDVPDNIRRAVIKDIGILNRDEAGALPCCGNLAEQIKEERRYLEPEDHDLNSCGDSPHQG